MDLSDHLYEERSCFVGGGWSTGLSVTRHDDGLTLSILGGASRFIGFDQITSVQQLATTNRPAVVVRFDDEHGPDVAVVHGRVGLEQVFAPLAEAVPDRCDDTPRSLPADASVRFDRDGDDPQRAPSFVLPIRSGAYLLAGSCAVRISGAKELMLGPAGVHVDDPIRRGRGADLHRIVGARVRKALGSANVELLVDMGGIELPIAVVSSDPEGFLEAVRALDIEVVEAQPAALAAQGAMQPEDLFRKVMTGLLVAVFLVGVPLLVLIGLLVVGVSGLLALVAGAPS